METINVNSNRMTILPTKDFTDENRRLTDGNRHLEVNARIALWCQENCGKSPSLEVFKRFRYFEDYFNQLHEHLMDVGSGPFQEIAYLMGKEMDNLIAETFGQETLNALNEGR